MLDLIFETDFVEGNPKGSPFHSKSIDIQLTKNLFGKLNSNSAAEHTKWAFIDCHGYSEHRIIRVIYQHLEIALVHISYSDYEDNYSRLSEEIQTINRNIKRVYVFIRDYEGSEETVQRKDESTTFIFLPNLTMRDMTVYSALKKIGYEILNSRTINHKQVGPGFIETAMGALTSWELKEIIIDKKLIHSIMEYIKKHPMSNREINFSFLSYYPSFVKYMNSYQLISSNFF